MCLGKPVELVSAATAAVAAEQSEAPATGCRMFRRARFAERVEIREYECMEEPQDVDRSGSVTQRKALCCVCFGKGQDHIGLSCLECHGCGAFELGIPVKPEPACSSCWHGLTLLLNALLPDDDAELAD